MQPADCFQGIQLQLNVLHKETQINTFLISFFYHIGIETGNRNESESISRIEIRTGIDQIKMIPNPRVPLH